MSGKPWPVSVVGGTMRQMRAIKALQLRGTHEAQGLLQTWADGAEGARLTSLAQTVLGQMKK